MINHDQLIGLLLSADTAPARLHRRALLALATAAEPLTRYLDVATADDVVFFLERRDVPRAVAAARLCGPDELARIAATVTNAEVLAAVIADRATPTATLVEVARGSHKTRAAQAHRRLNTIAGFGRGHHETHRPGLLDLLVTLDTSDDPDELCRLLAAAQGVEASFTVTALARRHRPLPVPVQLALANHWAIHTAGPNDTKAAVTLAYRPDLCDDAAVALVGSTMAMGRLIPILCRRPHLPEAFFETVFRLGHDHWGVSMFLSAVTSHPDCPAGILATVAAEASDRAARARAYMNPNLPTEAVAAAVAQIDKSEFQPELSVLANPNLPAELVTAAATKRFGVPGQRSVAASAQLTAAAQRHLLDAAKDATVADALARNAVTQPAVLAELAQRRPALHHLIWGNPAATTEVLTALTLPNPSVLHGGASQRFAARLWELLGSRGDDLDTLTLFVRLAPEWNGSIGALLACVDGLTAPANRVTRP